MANSLEEIEEKFEELEVTVTSQFVGLKKFTFHMLREAETRLDVLGRRVEDLEEKSSSGNVQEDIQKLDESIGSLRGEFEVLRSAACSPVGHESQSDVDLRKQKTPPTDSANAKKKAFRLLSLNKVVTSSPAEPEWPVQLEDIEDVSLRSSVEKYYEPVIAGSKLTPAQTAYFQYFMTEKMEGYTAKRAAIDKLILSGEKYGMWPKNFKPAGIKSNFRDYLKDKAKNCQKKRLCEKAMNEFAEEYNLEQ